MWLGFGLAAAIDLIQGLHVLGPVVPAIPLIKLKWAAFGNPPWTALRGFSYGIFPFAVPLGFFIPLDLSFSCWFLHLLSQAQLLFSEMLGLKGPRPEGFPYLASQAAGSWLALALGALLTSAPHLRRVLKQLLTDRPLSSEQSDPREARLLRFAAWAISIGLAGAFASGLAAGMSVGLVVPFLVLFYLIGIAINRVRAEFGAPHEIYYENLQRIISLAVGSRILGPYQLTALAVFWWFNRCYRCHPTPFQLESLKMAGATRTDRTSLVRVMLVATVAGIVLTYWANLQITLAAGAEAKAVGFRGMAWEHHRRLEHWLRNPSAPD